MTELFLVLAGLCGGIIAGMGMGGGTLLIPILTLLLGVEQHVAQCVNLISFIPMSIVALIIHSKNKLVMFRQTWHVALFAAIGAVAGAILSSKIDAKILGKLFGGFLCILAIFQFVVLIKNSKSDKEKKSK